MPSINIHCLALFGLAARLGVAFASDRVWHADEIFQYLEQGHRLAFGYGYIPWEYRFGTRSWILPGFISAILLLCKSLGIDDPPTYIGTVKVVFCLISISLIYSGYVLAREIAGETAGTLAGIFTCCWYELVYFAHKPNPEFLSAYLIAAALACIVIKPKKRNALLVGFFTAAAIALRVQYLPAIAAVAVFAYIRWKKYEILTAALVFCLTVAVTGYIDYLTWGTFGGSYYHNYLFNTVYGISEFFGTQRFSYYLESLTIASTGVFAVTGLVSLFKLDKTWVLLSVIASLIVSHSLIPHKEYRFIFATIPFFLLLLAIVVSDDRLIPISKRIYASVVIVCCVSMAGLFSNLPFQNRVVNRDLSVPLLAKEEILQAYLFLNKEPALAAILNAFEPWYGTGGYYYLHRDVPIYSSENLALNSDLRPYVSHIICASDEKDIPGFTVVRRIGNLDIRRQTNPPSRYILLDLDVKNVPQEGVDDKYTPTVRKRFF